MTRPYPILRSDEGNVRLPIHLGSSHSVRPIRTVFRAIVKERILRAVRVLFPSLLVLFLTAVAHAQGTMDFSGAQTLMGTFKTQLIMQCLRQIRGRGDSAIIYDPACEYIQRFYDEGRGDIVLNPLDARCPYWGPAQEMESNAEADAIAASLYQPKTDKVDEFFHETPAQIFAHLLKLGRRHTSLPSGWQTMWN